MPLGKMDKGEEEEELPTNCRAHISLSGSYGRGGQGLPAVAYDEHCTRSSTSAEDYPTDARKFFSSLFRSHRTPNF